MRKPPQRPEKHFRRDGGEGLPPVRHQDTDSTWLFTCVECGRRWVTPPGPVIGCSCGGDVVGHQFDTDDYRTLRREGSL
ncbi:hypothetical protein [Halostella sp. PRR32]|uniref:hypothetical protein n=1 Tax=Halostella sp. PRR32 TaxID=3098147 RepID=UPI002B1D1994|nr:hypothetical protein [Halostella sp. PRR32]